MKTIDKDYIDPQQLVDLQTFLKSLDDQGLKDAYEKTKNDAESDKEFGYNHGGNQASTLRNIAIIQTIMDERQIKY
jgi:hypothetical protein